MFLRAFRLKRFFYLLAVPISLLVILIAKINPGLVEKYYSAGAYKLVAQGLSSLIGLLPVSAAEILLYVFILSAAGYAITSVIMMCIDRQSWLERFVKFAANILAAASLLFVLFVFLCGLNYYRLPFADSMQFDDKNYSDELLFSLTDELVDLANNSREEVLENNIGVMRLDYDDRAALELDARRAYKRQDASYPVLEGLYGKPKPVYTSMLMNRLNIYGIYSAYTFEANYNTLAPDCTLPFNMCHELAHLRGFMREDEASYIAFVICRDSGNKDFVYSGYLSALTHTLNAVARKAPEHLARFTDRLSMKVVADIRNINEYWAQYDSALSEFSGSINDMYLRLNAQEEGVLSYEGMVKFLLAEHFTSENLN